jgi:hypothetical protein
MLTSGVVLHHGSARQDTTVHTRLLMGHVDWELNRTALEIIREL